MRHAFISIVLASLFAVVSIGCAKLGNIGGGTPATAVPSPSTSPTGSPGPCNTPSGYPNLVVVAVGPAINATSVAPYGDIGYYSVSDANGDDSPTAQIINVTQLGGSTPITSANILQFTNVDTSSTYHSAVGFTGDSFPSKPYAFPSPPASPSSSTIGPGVAWSTGNIAPQALSAAGALCFSQTFTLKPGTYYFADSDFYNATTAQDVLVVGTPVPLLRHKPYRLEMR
jgi:hypothetical protein